MPGERLSDKVAIVTGGASGIGLATTQRFVKEGARVMVVNVDGDRLASVRKNLGASVAVHTCDVRAEADVRAMVEATVEAFGGLDIAFANAGIGSLPPSRMPRWLSGCAWSRSICWELYSQSSTRRRE